MRTYLTSFLILAACVCRAETPAEFFVQGMKFFMNRDYSSAREMFKNSEADKGDIGAMSAYYLASIASFEGDPSAAALFEKAMSNPPKDSADKIARTYAKYAILNGQYANAERLLAPYAKNDGFVAWYYARALYALGKKAEAKEFFSEKIKKDFSEKYSAGMDMFADAYLEGDEFAKSFDISAIAPDSPTARSRLQIMRGEPLTEPQDALSPLGLIDLAESGREVDAQLLAQATYKYEDVPFAWRGALALSNIYFRKQDYAKAEVFARDARFLAPPEIESLRFVYIALADALRMQKKYSDALFFYEKIFMDRKVRGEPQAEALYKAGMCWFEQGEWGKAHAYFERVFVGYFKFEYWGARAYYYDARALYSLGLSRDANATLVEYLRRAKDRNSEIYKMAKDFYDKI